MASKTTMKTTMKTTTTLFVLAATTLLGCGNQPTSTHDPIAASMEGFVEAARVAGVVTMVVQNGETIHAHAAGFRDLESADALEMTDLFRIASQSKAVTSVAIMMLREEGKLDLDDELAHYIPEFAEAKVAVETDSGYRLEDLRTPITLRHLLTHTAGMSYGSGPAEEEYRRAGILGWYLADQERDIQEVARVLASLPLAAQPGEEYVYGYASDVLGAVIEIVSGEPLDRFFEDRILRPLGMNDTHFFVPAEKASRLVTVYGIIDGELKRMPDGSIMKSQGQYVDGPRTCFSGGAGLVSTAQDYIRLQLMLLNRGELDGVRILKPESVDEMTTNQVGTLYDAERGFGLGFRLYTERWEGPEPPGAFSWGGAYHSHYWVDPSNDLVAIILTQLIPADGNDIRMTFRREVYQGLGSGH
jgi:CubicO group peptidase (beta-lactamase class C family)